MLRAPLCTSLAVLGLALGATGCWGGSRAASSARHSTTTAPKPPPATRLTVRYAVGYGDHPGRCPRGAVCTTHTFRGSNLRTRIARFTLTCDPPRGTYPNPRTACAAAANYIKLRSRPQHDVCMCILETYRDTLTGVFQGTFIDLPIDPCTVCGMGRAAHHDSAVLLPTA
jgi:hypothetical protein